MRELLSFFSAKIFMVPLLGICSHSTHTYDGKIMVQRFSHAGTTGRSPYFHSFPLIQASGSQVHWLSSLTRAPRAPVTYRETFHGQLDCHLGGCPRRGKPINTGASLNCGCLREPSDASQ